MQRRIPCRLMRILKLLTYLLGTKKITDLLGWSFRKISQNFYRAECQISWWFAPLWFTTHSDKSTWTELTESKVSIASVNTLYWKPKFILKKNYLYALCGIPSRYMYNCAFPHWVWLLYGNCLENPVFGLLDSVLDCWVYLRTWALFRSDPRELSTS